MKEKLTENVEARSWAHRRLKELGSKVYSEWGADRPQYPSALPWR